MDKVGSSIQNSNLNKASGASKANAGKVLSNGKNGAKQLKPDYQLQLSDKSKDLKNQRAQNEAANSSSSSASASSSSSSVDVPDVPLPPVPTPPKINPKASDLLDTASKAKQVKDLAEIAKTKMQAAKLKNSPAVFFIKAFEFVETDLFANGMKSMAEGTEPARYYSWDQKDTMVEQIKKRDKNQPVVLVGHGFGGDTAVEIAQELNTIDNGFRKIDLLVTLNSSGMNNDFIPQNVVKNLNYITADNGWTDDGPNIALNYNRTKVENFLRPEGHDELDDSTDIQIEIMDAINKII